MRPGNGDHPHLSRRWPRSGTCTWEAGQGERSVILVVVVTTFDTSARRDDRGVQPMEVEMFAV